MSNIVQKITKLKYVNSFMQTDYIKGFKYIDKAGEIVNNYYEDGKEPNFQMTPSQLEILLKDKLLRISPKIFWINFNNPSSIEHIFNSYKKEYKIITKILEINEYKKLGWRNHFVYLFDGEKGIDKRDEIIKKNSLYNDITFESGTFSLKENDIKVFINISKVFLNEDKKQIPGILFDIDLIKTISTNSELDKGLLDMKSFLNGDKLLNIINSFLSKNDK